MINNDCSVLFFHTGVYRRLGRASSAAMLRWQLKLPNNSRCTALGTRPHEQLILCVRILCPGDSEEGTLPCDITHVT
jgi:hypothetical protein